MPNPMTPTIPCFIANMRIIPAQFDGMPLYDGSSIKLSISIVIVAYCALKESLGQDTFAICHPFAFPNLRSTSSKLGGKR